jgi:hypothetical protein
MMPPADRRSAQSGASARFDEKVAALLDAFRLGTPDAMQRHWRLTWHQRPWEAMQRYVRLDLGRPESDTGDLSLDDARWLIAREHAFDSWDELSRTAATEHALELLDAPIGVGRDVSTERIRHWSLVLERLGDPTVTCLDAHGQLTDDQARELVRFPQLTSLRLSGCARLTDVGVRAIAQLPNVRTLQLQGTGITDAAVGRLASMTTLRELSLAWTSVTDAGASLLGTLHALERLDVMGTATGDGTLHALAAIPTLRHLSTGSRVTDDGVTALHRYPNFARWQHVQQAIELLAHHAEPTSLVLRGAITNRGVAQLAQLHGLFALNIDDASLGLSGSALEPLVEMDHLGWLAFDAKDDAMRTIARLPHLRYLGCQDTSASDDAWAALGASRSIEAIWGRRCYGLSDRGFAALARLPTLQKLSVSCRSVSDAAIGLLPSFPSLQELMPMDVPDAGYRHIAKCDRLRSLVLMYCRDTTDIATAHIAGMQALESYFASYTRITDETPRMLAGIASLRSVTFDSCGQLTDDGVAALSRLPHLRTLRLSGRFLTPAISARFPSSVTVHYGT